MFLANVGSDTLQWNIFKLHVLRKDSTVLVCSGCGLRGFSAVAEMTPRATPISKVVPPQVPKLVSGNRKHHVKNLVVFANRQILERY